MRTLAVLFLLFALSTSASFAAPARRAVLVLRPELTADTVFRAGSPFTPLLPRVAVGVMNVAVRGSREPASTYLCLGAGERLAAGPLDRRARLASEVVEGDPAAIVYQRRMGPLPPLPRSSGAHAHQTRGSTPPALLHLEWAAYGNAPDPTYTPAEQQAAGGLGQALRPYGGVAWLGVGEAARTRWGALVALDARGTVPWGDAFRSPQLSLVGAVTALLHRAPLVVVDLPASFPMSRLAALAAVLSEDPERDVLLVSPFPPPGPGGAWDRLTPVLALGPEFQPGRLTSATTRTAGLVANIDVAPTLLAALGVPAPRTMSGRVMQCQPAGRRRGGLAAAEEVRRFAQAATLSTRGVIPVGVALEAASVLLLGLIVLALRRPAPLAAASPPLLSLPALASAGMLFIASVPLGLLLGPVTGPRTVLGLGLAVTLWAAAAAGVAFTASRLWPLSQRGIAAPGEAPAVDRCRREHLLDPARAGEGARAAAIPPASLSPLIWLAGLTVLVVAGDLLAGGTLIARSPLSGFPVIGIRFYGIGNEYLGVLIGMGLVAPLAFEEHLRRYRWAQAGLYLALLLLISSPRYGANFGGALAGAAGFGAALAMAARPRRPGRALLLAGGALLLAGAGALLWDALRPAAERTHIGDFAHAVWTSGWAAAAPVLRRKAAMDLRLLTSGYAAVPIAVVFPLVAFWYRGAGRGIAALMARRPELRAMAAGALVAAWTGLFLKDSGVAPWMLIQGSLLAVLLDEQLRARGACAAGRVRQAVKDLPAQGKGS